MPRQQIKTVDKPWGKEIIFAHTDKYVGKEIRINAGSLLSRQYHKQKDETIYIVEGPMVLEIGMDPVERIELKVGESYHVPPGTIHRYIAPQSNDCRLMEVSTTELTDVVRIEDRYGRA